MSTKASTTPAHLGGHFGITNMDRAALDYICFALPPIASMLDLGCGPGGMVDYAIDLGIDAWGVDGDPAIDHPHVRLHDFTRGRFLWRAVDLVWCVEFLEHLEPRYLDNVMATFDYARIVLITHALPGQGGYHHVNERSPEYWQSVMRSNGWRYLERESDTLRAVAADQYVARTGMLWSKQRRSLRYR